MSPSPRPVRWVLVAALVLCVLAMIAASAYLAYERGRQEGSAGAAEALERVTSTEAELDELRTETASLSAARKVAEDRAEVAWAIAEGAAAERDAVLASVRAPMAPAARARRASDFLFRDAKRGSATATGAANPNASLREGSVRALVLDGVPGMFVEAEAFEKLHEALELRPVLEAQVAALTEAHAAQGQALDLAVRELGAVTQERDVLRIAWAAAETDLAEAREGSGLPSWAPPVAVGAAVAVAVAGVLVGRATASGVTIVR